MLGVFMSAASLHLLMNRSILSYFTMLNMHIVCNYQFNRLSFSCRLWQFTLIKSWLLLEETLLVQVMLFLMST
jgi:hypothetical protein